MFSLSKSWVTVVTSPVPERSEVGPPVTVVMTWSARVAGLWRLPPAPAEPSPEPPAGSYPMI